MNISLLCSDSNHPVNAYLNDWILLNEAFHTITLARRKSDLPGGDMLFLISCSEIIGDADRAAYRASLVLHASDLPRSRGWSPHIWAILDGAETITLSLLEADDGVDRGRIWKKLDVLVPRHALWYEINAHLFAAEIELITFAIDNIEHISPAQQNLDVDPTYCRRRTAEDSRIDPQLSLEGQFDRIRVCDPKRFPAFFDLNGHRYKLILEKMDDQPDHD